MTHQDAMKETGAATTCQGQISKGNTFFSQDFTWTKGTCRLCGQQIALLGGYPHRFNYIIVDPAHVSYEQGYTER